MTPGRYAVVTPARNEAESLPRVAESLAAQTAEPELWIIAENGSTDGTTGEAERLASAYEWIRVVRVAAEDGTERAIPIVSAFSVGLNELRPPPDVVAKVDADITLSPTYFERLLEELERDPGLGVVSGTCFEQEGDVCRPRHVTGTSVWGAARAYRWSCLEQLLPLEARTAWDWIDVAEANLRGWTSRVLHDVPFQHHRREGERAPSRWEQWAAQGRAAHYLGYRPSYLALRAIYNGLRDPAALALVPAYASAVMQRQERCRKPDLLAYVRDQQRWRNVRRRVAEALGSPHP